MDRMPLFAPTTSEVRDLNLRPHTDLISTDSITVLAIALPRAEAP